MGIRKNASVSSYRDKINYASLEKQYASLGKGPPPENSGFTLSYPAVVSEHEFNKHLQECTGNNTDLVPVTKYPDV